MNAGVIGSEVNEFYWNRKDRVELTVSLEGDVGKGLWEVAVGNNFSC